VGKEGGVNLTKCIFLERVLGVGKNVLTTEKKRKEISLKLSGKASEKRKSRSEKKGTATEPRGRP